MKKLFSCFLFTVVLGSTAFADEGMWLLMYLKKMNEADMKSKGMKITADDIYNVNSSSLKDAVVNFGGFCTGEIISKEGLILTNHHCGYDAIAEHSTVEHDYLTNGFWAYEKSQEIPCEGLYVKFMVRMEDVTAKINAAAEGTSDVSRDNAIKAKISELKKAAIEGTKYEAEIKPFFEGNEYYLFVYEVFNDIRLVGAPPSSIGKFGGDTDNWMWPRHTGDFSMFRVYANSENKPAAYAKENVPYKPKHALPLSIKGIKENDFAMILGYPGSTDRFLASYGVKTATDVEQPERVKIRQARLETMKVDMDKSDEIRIKYASEYAQISNYWKYFIGQTRGLKRLKVYERKQEEEKKFAEWVNTDDKRKEKYGNALNMVAEASAEIDKMAIPSAYFTEAVFTMENHTLYFNYFTLWKTLEQKGDKATVEAIAASITPKIDEFFKNHNKETDMKLYGELLTLYYNNMPKEYHPKELTEAHKANKGDLRLFAKKYYEKSVLVDPVKLKAFLAKPDYKTFQKDLGFNMLIGFFGIYQEKITPVVEPAEAKLKQGMKLYIDGLRKMNASKFYAPDANFTMRCTYGNVLDYSPGDAMIYDYVSTIEGIMQKEDPKNEEFIVPAKLKELYLKKDYGRYGVNGTLPVGFLSNTDITGGNSGSPVINGNGELIGTAFDGNWEAMSGDIAFEPQLQRTISVDIRYTLFIIEKFAGATNLIKEMTIVE
ncbi:MAG TPA: S46 family peptidase [Flavobacteriales bacterium]|nr:S46 family peptidase [Flavobacteriales bacterium]